MLRGLEDIKIFFRNDKTLIFSLIEELLATLEIKDTNNGDEDGLTSPSFLVELSHLPSADNLGLSPPLDGDDLLILLDGL